MDCFHKLSQCTHNNHQTCQQPLKAHQIRASARKNRTSPAPLLLRMPIGCVNLAGSGQFFLPSRLVLRSSSFKSSLSLSSFLLPHCSSYLLSSSSGMKRTKGSTRSSSECPSCLSLEGTGTALVSSCAPSGCRQFTKGPCLNDVRKIRCRHHLSMAQTQNSPDLLPKFRKRFGRKKRKFTAASPPPPSMRVHSQRVSNGSNMQDRHVCQ